MITDLSRGLSAPRRWRPSRLSGLRLWLSADRITGLADGDPVTTWPDLSGQSNNATQSTTAAKPLYKTAIVNGRPGILFDGVDDFLTLPAAVYNALLSSDKSVFAVVKWVSVGAADGRVISGANTGSATRYAIRYTTGPVWGVLYTTGAAQASITASAGAIPSTSVSQIVETVQSGTSLIARVNGTQIATDPANAGTETAIAAGLGANAFGSGAFANVYICEVVVYNRALSTAEASAVRRYLGACYGVAVS